ncbi:similar to hypothetical protein MGC4266 (predicted) [Rattus norvegicus]|uniref:Uncharacterized protein RGD1563719_predicted n=1 Tax=Rattus norvegicus TaxID=10116 RepID=A6ILY5_RAT|nr:similar to hypothetical protein MGC4266 (predicted) [Rattus norvegicus]
MATPSGREDSSSQAPCHGEQGSEACVEELDHPERLEAEVPDQSVMWKKAQEFFQTCDSEGKGFIARTDLQRLHKELPLSLEELEDVFDALDADSNGFLTPEEFATGFSHFFFSQNSQREEDAGQQVVQLQEEKVYQSRGEEDMGGVDQDEEAQFQMLMDRLGAQKILDDESDVRQLWLQLKKDEPHLLSNFEDLLTTIFTQLQEAHEQKNELECALRKKIAAYDEEIQHLYEEMEQQIKSEREQFLLKSQEEEEVFGPLRRRSSVGLSAYLQAEEELGTGEPGTGVPRRQALRRIISIEEDPLPQLLEGGFEKPLNKCPEEEEPSDQGTEGQSVAAPVLDLIPSSPRGQPVGKETLYKERVSSAPDRLFKIVFVGDSAVGKTSFLRRLCEARFSPGMAATVALTGLFLLAGIDYRVKTVTVDNAQVALQLWDTAGQERYRCISQQFFRKADGVVVMYDLTAKQSFLSIRQWLSSVEEAVGDRIPVLLLGNKLDNEKEREVPRGLGEQLAKV